MKNKFTKALIIATFVIYLLEVANYTLGLYLLAIRKWFNPSLMVMGLGFSPEFNLIPFTNTAPATFGLNILLFIPFGMLLPLATRIKSVGKVVLSGALASILIEFSQLGIEGRITDINDLLTNTFGCLIGYGIYKGVSLLWRAKFKIS